MRHTAELAVMKRDGKNIPGKKRARWCWCLGLSVMWTSVGIVTVKSVNIR